jgi:quercetin dioxygenase-like cupin family protein
MRPFGQFLGLTLAAATAVAISTPATVMAQAAGHKAGHMDAPMKVVAAATLEWASPEIPGFDPGLKLAVVSGDPATEGAYTIRLSFPAGYNFPPHWHPMPENLTVLSGALNLAMGDKRDDSKLKRYAPGDYIMIDAKHPHFGGAPVATVIQLHGIGPFTIELVGKK